MPNAGQTATIASLAPLLAIPWRSIEGGGRALLAWLTAHTGIPIVMVAAILIVVGYRILKKSARFLVELALVAALLVAATHAGWLRW